MISKNNNAIELQEQILSQLKGINKAITIANASSLEKELTKYVTTPERRKAWALINGERDIPQIMKQSGLKRRSVYDFLEYLSQAGLLERPYGKSPKRLIDFIPANWMIELKSFQAETIKNSELQKDYRSGNYVDGEIG